MRLISTPTCAVNRGLVGHSITTSDQIRDDRHTVASTISPWYARTSFQNSSAKQSTVATRQKTAVDAHSCQGRGQSRRVGDQRGVRPFRDMCLGSGSFGRNNRAGCFDAECILWVFEERMCGEERRKSDFLNSARMLIGVRCLVQKLFERRSIELLVGLCLLSKNIRFVCIETSIP